MELDLKLIRHNKIKRLLDPTNRPPTNVLIRTPGESDRHFLKKRERFNYWISQGEYVLCEALFNKTYTKNYFKCDILVTTLNPVRIEEIIFSETFESQSRKLEIAKRLGFEIVFIKA
jgi:hypothetical protein